MHSRKQIRARIINIAAAFLFAIHAFCYAQQAPHSAPILKLDSDSTTRNALNQKMQQQNVAIQFDEISANSGVTFQLENSLSPARYSIETMLGGVALFDYNNDGLLDIFFTNGAAIPSLTKDGEKYWNRLYRNNGDGSFTDVTQTAGVQGIGYSMGVAVGDYDNDGWEDLYITGVNANQLLHNNGDGTFTDRTQISGLDGIPTGKEKPWSVAAGWFDYDNDGLLDLLVVNYLDYSLPTAKLCELEGKRSYCAPGNFSGTANILYHNDGNGHFTDVSRSSHISDFIGKGMGIAFADYDNDGFTDVYISNDTHPNFLIHNNGNGSFSEVALEAGVAYTATGDAVAGMGADFRDLDNDGRPDIFHTAMFGNTFPIYRNTGSGFDDMTEQSGLAAYSRRMTAWSAAAFDFDNDGWKDLFVSGGAILDNEEELLHRPTLLPNGILRNNHNFHFTDNTQQTGAAFQKPLQHRGAAFGDFNNDGKIDLVVSAIHATPEIFKNVTQGNNHWILLKLLGKQDNRDGLGTQVKIKTCEGTQYNQATTAVGYNSSSDKRVHFGLGNCTKIDSLELRWPTGVHQEIHNIDADQVLTILEEGLSARQPSPAHQ